MMLRSRSKQFPFIFYILYFFIIFSIFHLSTGAASNSLYSNFNANLEKIAEYAENQLSDRTSPYFDQILQANSEIINKAVSRRKRRRKDDEDVMYDDVAVGDDNGSDQDRNENGDKEDEENHQLDKKMKRTMKGGGVKRQSEFNSNRNGENLLDENLRKLIEILSPYYALDEYNNNLRLNGRKISEAPKDDDEGCDCEDGEEEEQEEENGTNLITNEDLALNNEVKAAAAIETLKKSKCDHDKKLKAAKKKKKLKKKKKKTCNPAAHKSSKTNPLDKVSNHHPTSKGETLIGDKGDSLPINLTIWAHQNPTRFKGFLQQIVGDGAPSVHSSCVVIIRPDAKTTNHHKCKHKSKSKRQTNASTYPNVMLTNGPDIMNQLKSLSAPLGTVDKNSQAADPFASLGNILKMYAARDVRNENSGLSSLSSSSSPSSKSSHFPADPFSLSAVPAASPSATAATLSSLYEKFRRFSNSSTSNPTPTINNEMSCHEQQSTTSSPPSGIVENVGNKTSAGRPIESKSNATDCPQVIDSNNATAVLERVLQELELIRQAKVGNAPTEGAPCCVAGSWNSELIGMRFDINLTNNETQQKMHGLNIQLVEHSPPKKNSFMDTNWTISGYALHERGGPFYMAATKKNDEVLATFTGICKACGGVDTIFGTWNFIQPARDCRDLQMSLESKRDILRKEVLHLRRIEKIEKMNSSGGGSGGASDSAEESTKKKTETHAR